MMHQHGAHIIRALPPLPERAPQPGDLPGWTGEPIPAPDPRTAVHRSIAPPPAVKESLIPAPPAAHRPTWPAAIALALICAALATALATYHALPPGEATRVATRATP